MIFMPIIMVSPLWGLLLFYYLPLGTALPLYIAILIVGVYFHIIMFRSMRAKHKTGVEAMIGMKAIVIKDIDPEGKIEIMGEIWAATARDKKIAAGKKVEIVEVRGLILIVKTLDEDK
jgi:membrane-bound serine protease (ClpP class)